MAELIILPLQETKREIVIVEVKDEAEKEGCTCFDSGGHTICGYCIKESQIEYWEKRRKRSSGRVVK